ncbi:MAG: hypothetical protein CVU39_02385 [Chloroflexi bacterium HGW-Chloroflexi-10]|nr:MAG: hypothetical protein CVU39_02385 [Chloroflexi bacterium HGW-Chloroflexi-10]
MIKAFIFDFDGLMVDTEIACYQAWLDIYGQFNADLPFLEYSKCIGTSELAFDPFNYLIDKTGKNLDRINTYQLHQRAYRAVTKKLPLMPGIQNYLDWAKSNQIKLAVASSSNRNWVLSHLSDLGVLPYFNAIMTSDDVHNVKPDPELFLKAAQAIGISSYEALIFEDSQNGIKAATLAHQFAIAIPNQLTKQMDLSGADLILTGLNNIQPEQLVKIFQS